MNSLPLNRKRQVDLLALVGGDTQLRKVASTRGNEYAGPCPFCGGRDRFRVQPEQRLWWCRRQEDPRCQSGDRWQDAIAYVMKRDRFGYRDACGALGLEGAGPTRKIVHMQPRRLAPPPAAQEPPGEAWQAAALALVYQAEQELWGDAGIRALAYLRGRGLADETIRRFRLGLNAQDRYSPAAAWGLDGKPLWLPRGILIPCHIGGVCWYLKFRRATGEPKYIQVRDGRPALFNADTLPGRPLALALEGEFDAMLAEQEAGDLVAAVTLGSASLAPAPRWLWALRDASRILVAYDADDEGRRGAGRWAQTSARVVVCHPPALNPGDKDLTDMHLAGGDVRGWISEALLAHAPGDYPVAKGTPAGVAARALGVQLLIESRGLPAGWDALADRLAQAHAAADWAAVMALLGDLEAALLQEGAA